MWNAESSKKSLAARLTVCGTLFAVINLATSCSRPENAAVEHPSQRTFVSPQEAGDAFLEAAKSGDHNALLAIFGPDANDLLASGDQVKDQAALQDFTAAYTQMHRWRKIAAGGEVLYIGADNYTFPIPLGQNPAGRWYFDTAAGRDEILARRIGKDELAAIGLCQVLVQAQQEYFGKAHAGATKRQYAQKFVSDDGKENGLYWAVTESQALSPLDGLREFAKAAGYTNGGSNPQSFDGYYFKILTKQGDKAKGGAKNYLVDGDLTGGFAIVAYPAKYRDSGIMTFIVGPDGIVYQKDLGEKTSEAAQMTEYNPGDGWSPAT